MFISTLCALARVAIKNSGFLSGAEVFVGFCILMPMSIVFGCGVPALAITGIACAIVGCPISWALVAGISAIIDVLWCFSALKSLPALAKEAAEIMRKGR